MSNVHKVLRKAAIRLFVLDVLNLLALTLTVGATGLIVAVLIERLFGLDIAWRMAIWAAGGGSVAVALGWALIRRVRGVALARELDERAGLRETMSTALCVERESDAWSRVVVQTAEDRAKGLEVKRAVPIEPPRLWPIPFGTVFAFAVLWAALPTFDVLGLLDDKRTVAEEVRQIQEAKLDIAQKQEAIKKKLEKAGVKLDEVKADVPEPSAPESLAEVKRQAIKSLTNLKNQLNKKRLGRKGQKMDALKGMMRQLKTPGPGPMDELARAMARGDFQKAQQALDDLARKLGQNELSAEQREQLRKQLENLQKQLDKLAKDRKDLEEQLKKAGMDAETAKRLAKDPEALKKALEKMQGLSEQQKQQLQQMAQSQSDASKQCSSMASSMGMMAKGMGMKGMDQMGMQGMDAFSGQLGEMEMMAAEMAAMDAAMDEMMGELKDLSQYAFSECPSGQCSGGECSSCQASIGMWSEGDSRSMGIGSGGPGRGQGPSIHDEEADFGTNREKARVKNKGGPIIGSRMVYGEQIRGESVAEFAAVVEAGAESAAEALETLHIPRELHGPVKEYFGRQSKRAAEAQETKTKDAPPAEEAQDADEDG